MIVCEQDFAWKRLYFEAGSVTPTSPVSPSWADDVPSAAPGPAILQCGLPA